MLINRAKQIKLLTSYPHINLQYISTRLRHSPVISYMFLKIFSLTYNTIIHVGVGIGLTMYMLLRIFSLTYLFFYHISTYKKREQLLSLNTLYIRFFTLQSLPQQNRYDTHHFHFPFHVLPV